MCKLLIVIPIVSVFDHGDEVSELLIQEGQWMEVTVHFSRESVK
ncbi:hypothetical protein [Pseudomonas sp. PDM25]|jgi:hypothetical protein|nr:hypothetical protein [Pseudomonas sp. PDM25]